MCAQESGERERQEEECVCAREEKKSAGNIRDWGRALMRRTSGKKGIKEEQQQQKRTAAAAQRHTHAVEVTRTDTHAFT